MIFSQFAIIYEFSKIFKSLDKGREDNASSWMTPCSTMKNSLKLFFIYIYIYIFATLDILIQRKYTRKHFPLIPSFISFFKEKKNYWSYQTPFLSLQNNNIDFSLFERCFSMKPWSENIVSNVLTPCLNLNCASARSELSLDHLINFFLV